MHVRGVGDGTGEPHTSKVKFGQEIKAINWHLATSASTGLLPVILLLSSLFILTL